MYIFLFGVVDWKLQMERGDAAAQDLVNSLQVLEVTAGAMAPELKPLVIEHVGVSPVETPLSPIYQTTVEDGLIKVLVFIKMEITKLVFRPQN